MRWSRIIASPGDLGENRTSTRTGCSAIIYGIRSGGGGLGSLSRLFQYFLKISMISTISTANEMAAVIRIDANKPGFSGAEELLVTVGTGVGSGREDDAVLPYGGDVASAGGFPE